MRKSSLTAILVIAVVIIFSQYYRHKNEPKVSGAVFDTSIKVAYGEPIKVAEVIDGDTVVLANGDHLRYTGVDSPEEFDSRKPVQCFAKEAMEKNRELVEGKIVKIYKDVTEKDRYGRWLGFIYLEDGTFINQKLVSEGYAFAYPFPPDISKSTDLASSEAAARSNKLGLWSSCSVYQTSSGREQTNAVE